MIPLEKIDRTWTLFIDRDGVINHEKLDDYIHTWDEFRFYDAVLDAMRIFKAVFNRVIVITNQRGVGKGITKLDDLHTIHYNMEQAIEQAGGHLDAVYYCTELNNDNPYRKPNPGMGLDAVKQFPEIDLRKTIMVGNTISDMEFGRNLGAYTVFLPTTRPEVDIHDKRIDLHFESLYAFAQALEKAVTFS